MLAGRPHITKFMLKQESGVVLLVLVSLWILASIN